MGFRLGIPESELIRMRYRRYITVSLLLIIAAILITAIANEIRSIWLLIIAFAILFAAFGLLFTGLTLRAEYNIMKELRRRRPSKILFNHFYAGIRKGLHRSETFISYCPYPSLDMN